MSITGIYHDFKKKENIDVSDTDFIRFQLSETKYIDFRINDGIIDVNSSGVLSVILAGGANHLSLSTEKR